MILHFSHMGLTDGLTFILFNLQEKCLDSLLASPGDTTMSQVVRRHLYGYLVTGQDPDKVHSELAGNVCQNGVSIADVDGEHCIRQCIGYDALNLDYVVLCQVVNLQLAEYFPGSNKPGLFVIRC